MSIPSFSPTHLLYEGYNQHPQDPVYLYKDHGEWTGQKTKTAAKLKLRDVITALKNDKFADPTERAEVAQKLQARVHASYYGESGKGVFHRCKGMFHRFIAKMGYGFNDTKEGKALVQLNKELREGSKELEERNKELGEGSKEPEEVKKAEKTSTSCSQVATEETPETSKVSEPSLAEIKECLRKNGILPSTEEAKKKLSDNAENQKERWLLIPLPPVREYYDGTQPNRSDEFIVRDRKDTTSAEAAAQHFRDNIESELTTESYRNLHLAICPEDQKWSVTPTSIDAYKQWDIYIATQRECDKLSSISSDFEKNAQVGDHNKKWLKNKYGEDLTDKTNEEFSKFLSDKQKEVKEALRREAPEHVTALNKEFEQLGVRLGLEEGKLIANVRLVSPECPERFVVDHLADNREQLTHKLFEEFNVNLAKLQTETYHQLQKLPADNIEERNQQADKIKKDYQSNLVDLVGKLHSELGTIHPFEVEQGLTDIILLEGLLVREGNLSLPSFRYPLAAQGNTVDIWLDYLIEEIGL